VTVSLESTSLNRPRSGQSLQQHRRVRDGLVGVDGFLGLLVLVRLPINVAANFSVQVLKPEI
jgi:hypothetical protein